MSAHWMDEDPDSPSFTEAECIALEALRARIRQENGVPMLKRVRAVAGDHRPVSRPGHLIYDDMPAWMYPMAHEERLMAVQQRRAVLALVILSATLVGAVVLVGVAWRFFHG